MKSLLVPFSGKTSSVATLEAAFKFAKEWGLELRCLHAVANPEAFSNALNEAALYVPNDVKEDISRTGQKLLLQARKSFMAVAEYVDMETGKDKQAQFLQVSGTFEDNIIHHSRFADLVVMRLPGEESTPEQDLALHAALFESGRPVLLLPKKETSSFGQHVAIAWSNSREAALTLHHALPLLRKAKNVSVIRQAKDEKQLDHEIEPLRHYLKLHGISIKVHNLVKSGDAGPLILEECHRIRADMLVMGAFTHHRLRQLILGGVTHHMLKYSDIPLLMAH